MDVRTVHDATTRYLQTVDALTDNEIREPSVLPGWTRAHVVAHVANHALGCARALGGLRHAIPTPVYDSDGSRHRDIELRSAWSADRLREFTFDACGRFQSELEHLPPDGSVFRTPGGEELSIPQVVQSRWREVEIHHADLLLDYTPAHWPLAFAAYLIDLAAWDRGEDLAITLQPTDLEGPVRIGAGGQLVSGLAGDLAWWLVGRGTGEQLTSSEPLPTLGPWTRRTRVR